MSSFETLREFFHCAVTERIYSYAELTKLIGLKIGDPDAHKNLQKAMVKVKAVMVTEHRLVIGTVHGVGYTILTHQGVLEFVENRMARLARSAERLIGMLETCVDVSDLGRADVQRYERLLAALREVNAPPVQAKAKSKVKAKRTSMAQSRVRWSPADVHT